MILTNDWLYIRIYTGFNTADQYLMSVLSPLSNEMIAAGMADRWFFIRYADTDFHLRYRIRILDKIKAQTFLEQLNNSLEDGMQSMLIWKYESGIYVPEKERYGLNAIEYAECIFQQDSEAVVRFIKNGSEIMDENSRWLFAISSVNALLEDFNFSLQEKKSLLLQLNQSFGKEFGKDKHLAKQLSERYRKFRLIIKSMLGDGDLDEVHKAINDILTSRSGACMQAIQHIMELYDKDKIEVSRDDLVSSLIHMSMNRIFRNNNRLHEMVVYDFLFRYYKSVSYLKCNPL